jgi:hypothetical protein
MQGQRSSYSRVDVLAARGELSRPAPGGRPMGGSRRSPTSSPVNCRSRRKQSACSRGGRRRSGETLPAPKACACLGLDAGIAKSSGGADGRPRVRQLHHALVRRIRIGSRNACGSIRPWTICPGRRFRFRADLGAKCRHPQPLLVPQGDHAPRDASAGMACLYLGSPRRWTPRT